VPARQLGVAGASLALGASVTLGASNLAAHQAIVGGAIASVLAAFALSGARRPTAIFGSVRMGIVPWGVLVDNDDAPRILRWAAVKRVDIAM
jgi:hypothetical protein